METYQQTCHWKALESQISIRLEVQNTMYIELLARVLPIQTKSDHLCHKCIAQWFVSTDRDKDIESDLLRK